MKMDDLEGLEPPPFPFVAGRSLSTELQVGFYAAVRRQIDVWTVDNLWQLPRLAC